MSLVSPRQWEKVELDRKAGKMGAPRGLWGGVVGVMARVQVLFCVQCGGNGGV